MAKPTEKGEAEEKPKSPELCPQCNSDNTTILRKEPANVAYGHKITRKCNSCGKTWSYTARYGAGAWV